MHYEENNYDTFILSNPLDSLLFCILAILV